MLKKLRNIQKRKYWDYFILVSRMLLGWTFLSYGFSKLSNGQFGISEIELTKQLKDVSLFKLSWYLFDHQPFKSFIGVSQIICGTLLILNRTVLFGAFLFIPITVVILIMDLTFMPPWLAYTFTWRLSFYLFLDILILLHYKERMKAIWNATWNNVNTKFKFPLWAYLILPFLVVALEILGAVLKMLTHPIETINSFEKFPKLLQDVIEKILQVII